MAKNFLKLSRILSFSLSLFSNCTPINLLCLFSRHYFLFKPIIIAYSEITFFKLNIGLQNKGLLFNLRNPWVLTMSPERTAKERDWFWNYIKVTAAQNSPTSQRSQLQNHQFQFGSFQLSFAWPHLSYLLWFSYMTTAFCPVHFPSQSLLPYPHDIILTRKFTHSFHNVLRVHSVPGVFL